MKKFITIFTVLISAISSNASGNLPLSIKEPSLDNEYQYAVEMIQRICPTIMWDSWVFRQIWFDEEDYSIIMALQPYSFDAEEQVAPKEIEKQTEFVLQNFEYAYKDIQQENTVLCDGDFMLFMSIGKLLHCIRESKKNVGLRVIFLKPDNDCIINPAEPQRITGSKLKSLIM